MPSSCECDCLSLEIVPAALNYVLRGALCPREWAGLKLRQCEYHSLLRIYAYVLAENTR